MAVELTADLGAVGGSILGMAYDQATMGQQMANQQELLDIAFQNEMDLMGLQMGHQMALNQQGQDLQLDLWNKTNYAAQMEHMRKAGLNPALMYSKGAGAGGSTGSQTGGSAAKGSPTVPQAPQRPEFELYGLQAQLMQEQAKDIKSQRNKRDGVDTDLAREEITEKRLDQDLKRIKKEYNEKGYIDGNYFATLMNMLGKDPINNPEDKDWIMNRVYTYFGVKLGSELLKSAGYLIGNVKGGGVVPPKTITKKGLEKRIKVPSNEKGYRYKLSYPKNKAKNYHGNDGYMGIDNN